MSAEVQNSNQEES